MEIVGGIYSTLPSLTPLEPDNVSLVRTDGGAINKAITLEVQNSPVPSALVLKMKISEVMEDMAGWL